MSTQSDSYRYNRQLGYLPAMSLQHARLDAAAGKSRYPRTCSDTAGAPFKSGSTVLRWVENPTANGLRFVGFADEIAGIRHTGWFTDEFQDSTLRGVVYQLPARGGRSQYVPGYQESDRGDEGAALAFGDTFAGDRGGLGGEYYTPADSMGAHRDAAYRADSIAETAAESEREYQEAWQAGSRYSDLGNELADARRAALALIGDMKRDCGKLAAVADSIRSAIGREVRAAVATVEELRIKRADIRDEFEGSTWRAHLWDAFADGAGIPSGR